MSILSSSNQTCCPSEPSRFVGSMIGVPGSACGAAKFRRNPATSLQASRALKGGNAEIYGLATCTEAPSPY
jgi:hypothetical protein